MDGGGDQSVTRECMMGQRFSNSDFCFLPMNLVTLVQDFQNRICFIANIVFGNLDKTVKKGWGVVMMSFFEISKFSLKRGGVNKKHKV